MRIARIAHPEGVAFVAVEGDGPDLVAAEIAEHPFGAPTFTGRRWPLADTRVLAPILPTKIICVGKNYADHAAEMGGEAPANPVIFMKPSTTVIGPGAAIKLPRDSTRVDFEGELAAVIGMPCRDVPAAKAKDVILGYTIANDVTARDQQKADGQFTRAKGHDTFCPLGPWIETAVDPSDLGIQTSVDGELKQDGRTSKMIHDVPALVEWISRVMTLLPGDVILTGTPAGVGPIVDGQSVTVKIDGLGELTNPVAKR
ncbi:2-hydroxyhepta-2,4-diene-1,7-dioate isomerase / 5-carboxymethyl-2-oxo-hex-3-ene-1,7-dioate decarboxylase [Alloactinosynnema sp. L-07]|uniref:fumarylacetoacetate hydrolase family protein n=1 Tax=Alloactinosynnema sp. L-07 TaxID=1653480 RepID=UPI00065EF20A|nr:fumarylacetoacetate hydrolase family protein [Alloactinosynnema sp. L-07]CRK58873.1 2-hydroxyhepta-2,4-diene-1,7-dioate isomerase / 5-carboxymethyl-2-oxo-hex-3-ene-1,7-dioate decarboxylase [Alloactinosynnema sp. L-07]